MPYQKRTMRRAMPLTREMMKRTNEAERHFKALKRMTDEMYASDKAVFALDKNLRDMAKERGVDVEHLTNDDFWPDREDSKGNGNDEKRTDGGASKHGICQ